MENGTWAGSHVFQMFIITQLKQLYTLWAHYVNMSEDQL